MDNEPYYDLTHLEIIATVSDWLRCEGCKVTNEHTLPSGKVADVIYTTPGGAIHIVECKLEATTTLIDAAYDKYYQWCNGLWVAAQRSSRFEPRRSGASLDFGEAARKTGLLVVHRASVRIERDAACHTLDPEICRSVRSSLPQG